MEANKSGCATCKHETLPSGIEPCCHCLDYENWEPKAAEPVAGFDPGAPEGDMTNVRLDWGESGQELIGPQDITSADVRSKIASIGIKFTDKNLSRNEIDFLVGQLNALQCDLFELEKEREAAEHVKNPDA